MATTSTALASMRSLVFPAGQERYFGSLGVRFCQRVEIFSRLTVTKTFLHGSVFLLLDAADTLRGLTVTAAFLKGNVLLLLRFMLDCHLDCRHLVPYLLVNM